jgi:hypothetical protein
MRSEKLNIIVKIILWIARIWGTLILAFVLFFLIADLFGGETPGGGLKKNEIMSFIFFPGCTVVGLTIALKWEGLGGLIATIGIIGLFITRIDLITNPIFVMGIAPPGILYIIYWSLTRRQNKTLRAA